MEGKRYLGASSSFWKGLLVAAIVVEMAVVVLLVAGRDSATTTSDSAVNNAPGLPTTGTGSRFVHPRLGYSFDYPDGWTVERQAAVTKLVAPGNDMAIAVGPAPSGDVLASNDSLLAGLGDRYENIQADAPRLTRVGGELGLTVTGTAVNEVGVTVTFKIVTIEGGERSYAITSFAAPSAVKDAKDALDIVVGGFEIE